jgi:hypothetical protein
MTQRDTLEELLYQLPDQGGMPGHVDYEHYADDRRSGCNGCVQLRRELRESAERDEQKTT